jgi:hypothetical protein
MNGDNPSDPAFWENLGITPIVIDDSTPESFEASMNLLDAAIENAVEELVKLRAEND